MEKLIENFKKVSLINNRKRILKNYYSKELRKGKTYRAFILDRILLNGILFIILSLVLTIKSNRLIISMFMSGIALYFIITINSSVLSKSKNKKIKLIKENLKKQKITRELLNLNKEDFIQYMQKILEGYYDIKVEKALELLDLKLIKDGDTFGIKCIKHTMDDRISTREVELFMNDLDSLDLDDGIMITNTYFSDGIKDNSKIILLDFDNIVEILKDLHQYPKDEDIEDYIVDRFTDNRNEIKNQVKEFNKRKIIQLYGLCAVFYVLSYFISFPLYYKIMAVITFVIATIVSGYKIAEYIMLKDSFNINKN